MVYINNKIVYLSGPMSGIADFNKPAFFEAERLINECSNFKVKAVLNPAVLPAGLKYQDYIKIDLAMVSVADCIVLLAGWRNSPGVAQELKFAELAQKPHFELDYVLGYKEVK